MAKNFSKESTGIRSEGSEKYPKMQGAFGSEFRGNNYLELTDKCAKKDAAALKRSMKKDY